MALRDRVATRSGSVWDPFSALSHIDREFDQLVEQALTSPPRMRSTAGYVPAVEMVADGSDVLIRIELPGVDVEKDVQIEVADSRLIVVGQRHEADGTDRSGVLIRELRYGAFRREFALPDGIDAERVEATYDAGMLEIRVRDVVSQPTPPARISIQPKATAKTSAPVIDGTAGAR